MSNRYLHRPALWILSSVFLAAMVVLASGQGTAQVRSESQFKILSPTGKQKLEPEKRITVSGEHKLPKDVIVWVFVVDNFGGYYLQTPAAVLLSDGTWEQRNVWPGKGIGYVVAVLVNDKGNERLLGWAREKRFGKIAKEEIVAIPGYKELDRVAVETPD